MIKKISRSEVRANKHRRIRSRLNGTPDKPRLAVFRSNNHMYAQIIDDEAGNTIVSASTVQDEVKKGLSKTNNVEAAAKLGEVIAKKAKDNGINQVVFDRGGYIYQGKVKALAEADTVVTIKRVTKVVKGGRNMRFSALVVVGDKNGRVGAGLGKAAEIPEAIRKGKEAAIKSMINVPLDENKSIPHDFIGEFGSANVLMKRSPEGTGIIAGGPARAVLELAGFKNIRTKSLGSRNKQNVVLATIEGLKGLKTPEEVARLRGISVDEVLN